MFLCVDPGSKYLGYTLIDNFQIYDKGVIKVQEQDMCKELDEVIKANVNIHTVLLEKGEKIFRDYEKLLVNYFSHRNIRILMYNAKQVRKRLRLERHPKTLSIAAKENLIQKKFSDISVNDISDHEIDSALLYLYHQRTS